MVIQMEGKKLVIKPSLWKALVLSLFKVFVLTMVIIGLFYLAKIVGFGFFVDMLKQIGYTTSMDEVIRWFSMSIITVLVLSLALDIVNLAGVKCILYEKGLEYHQNLVNWYGKKIVPYKNIERITFDDSRIGDKILRTGKINIYLTEMELDKIELENISKVREVIRRIKGVLTGEEKENQK
jgi:hypothetical protein